MPRYPSIICLYQQIFFLPSTLNSCWLFSFTRPSFHFLVLKYIILPFFKLARFTFICISEWNFSYNNYLWNISIDLRWKQYSKNFISQYDHFPFTIAPLPDTCFIFFFPSCNYSLSYVTFPYISVSLSKKICFKCLATGELFASLWYFFKFEIIQYRALYVSTEKQHGSYCNLYIYIYI